MFRRPFILAGILSTSSVISCGPPSITYMTVPVAVAQNPSGNGASAKNTEREDLAVLPIDDEKLFRAERSLLRFELTGHLARLLPDRKIVPLADVDTKIRPVSQSTGHLCAFENEDIEKRARYKGWQTTRIMHVAGLENGPGEQLWVEILDGTTTLTTFQGPWNPKQPRVDAYRGAFAAFVKNDGGAILGGLSGRGDYKDALQQGTMTVCETKFFGSCEKSSVDWQDRIDATAECFTGADEVTRDLLVQGDVGPYCELENLEYPDGKEAKLEACLCKTLGTSTAMAKRSGRRTIRVHYEAPDLAGKPRPELRVVEVSTNIGADEEWHSMSKLVNGKKEYTPVNRFVVDNLDALAAPLSRCAVPAGIVIVADIDVREDGTALAGKILAGNLDKSVQVCLEQAMSRGAFNCTDDGKSGRIRIAMEWPAM